MLEDAADPRQLELSKDPDGWEESATPMPSPTPIPAALPTAAPELAARACVPESPGPLRALTPELVAAPEGASVVPPVLASEPPAPGVLVAPPLLASAPPPTAQRRGLKS